MRKLAFLGAAAAIALTSPAYAATNLIVNGSFETGNFAGWNVTTAGGGVAPVVIAYNQASPYPTGAYGEAIPTDPLGGNSPDPAGRYAAYFVSDTANPHTITQTASVAFTAGTTYELGFDYYVPQNGYNNPNDASLSFSANFNNQTFQLTNLTTGSPSSNTPPLTWRHFSTLITPTVSGNANIAFNYTAGGVTAADFVVDRVYAIAAVPEPSTWAMMCLGFAAVGFAARRRSKVAGRVVMA